MKSGSDSSDSRYDSSDSRERPLPTKESRTLGIVAVCLAVLSFVGLLGCYGCAYRAVVIFPGGLRMFPLLFLRPQHLTSEMVLISIVFIVCSLVSLAGALIGVVTGIISLFEGQANRRLGGGALVSALVWACGVGGLVAWI